jgi:hypothetical protein
MWIVDDASLLILQEIEMKSPMITALREMNAKEVRRSSIMSYLPDTQ